MSSALQIWLIAAPPAAKFATIACVTDCGNGDTPLRDHAMIAGENRDQRTVDMRRGRALPAGQQRGDVLEPAEGAGRLGQLPRARARGGGGRFVGRGIF